MLVRGFLCGGNLRIVLMGEIVYNGLIKDKGKTNDVGFIFCRFCNSYGRIPCCACQICGAFGYHRQNERR